jgi:hypothetical protein
MKLSRQCIVVIFLDFGILAVAVGSLMEVGVAFVGRWLVVITALIFDWRSQK